MGYEKASFVEGSFDHFDIRLERGRVAFEMKTHFSTVEEARAITDDFVRRWEIVTGLEQNPGDLRFKYDNVDVIDLEPDEIEGITGNLNVTTSDDVLISEAVAIHIGRGKYPSLPIGFAISPDMEAMYLRYKAYRENKERLTTVAYWCLTVLEDGFSPRKKRREAAKCYRIDHEILNKIGQLSERRGTVSDARKYPVGGSFDPLSSQERSWLEAAIKKLIFRVGQYAFDPSADLPLISMADLPPLK